MRVRAETAESFENPDFVDVVIHPTATATVMPRATPRMMPPRRSWRQAANRVPTIVLHGGADGVLPLGGSANHEGVLFRWLQAPGDSSSRPQRAAGSAARVRGVGAGTGPAHEIATTVAARHFTNRSTALTFRVVVNN